MRHLHEPDCEIKSDVFYSSDAFIFLLMRFAERRKVAEKVFHK